MLQKANQTMTRFGYPETLIQAYEHWVVLLRDKQVTLGSLILCSRSDATAFSALSSEAFGELQRVIKQIEHSLTAAFHYEKINYLMLMMSDPNVHFHVIPRYSTPRSACGLTLSDGGWPAVPKLNEAYATTAVERAALCRYIQGYWRLGA